MNLLKLIQNRYSVRNYSSQPIEKEKIEYALEAARLAPSAVNYQPWYFILVQETEGRKHLQECYPREWFTSVPMYIIVCGDHSQSWKRASDQKDHMDIDIAIATEHICLAAAEQGLGCCWVCNFDVQLCKKYFNIPDTIDPAVIIPIGYPAAQPNEVVKKRKDIQEIIKQESF